MACPAALTAKSGCVRESDAIDETPTGASSVSTWTSGAAAVAATSPVVQVVAVSSSSSSIVAASTTAAATSAVASSGETVPQYGKCGGDGYTGSTECAAGFTCKWSNAYYSQCL